MIKKFTRCSRCLTLLLVLILCVAGCGSNNIIICSFEFINPETGEYITPKPSGVNDYGEIYLTYDGEQKNINFRTVRDDNGREVNFIEDIDISYTYKNPKTGVLEYGKQYMQEEGEYYLCINSCSYDEAKYFIHYLNVQLTIYLQQ